MGESEGVTVYDGDGSTTARVEDHKDRNNHSNRSQAARELIAVGDRVAKAKTTLYVGLAAILVGIVLAGGRLIVMGHTVYWQAAGVLIVAGGFAYALLMHRVLSNSETA